MSETIENLNKLSLSDVEAAVKEVQKTPGGMKIDIILSPAVQKVTPKHQSASTTPQTQQEIAEKLTAAEQRRQCLEKLRIKNITAQLAKIDDVKTKREEINAEVSAKSRSHLETKLEKTDLNRSAHLEHQLNKLADKLANVEKVHKEKEIAGEASRIAKECDLVAKLNKAHDKREERLEEKVAKLREHELKVKVARQTNEKQLNQDKTKTEAELKNKLEKAAKERERQEAELKCKLEEHSKHVQTVRQNKHKSVAPQSA
jgi:DNA repair exonuclease SbcCD ATPase subunit